MLDQVFDNFRKATETTLQAQQDLFRQWMSQWPMSPDGADAPSGASAVTRAGPDVPEAMDRQRHRADDQALRGPGRAVPGGHQDHRGCAADHGGQEPRGIPQLTEELWRKSFEVLKQTIENQIRDFQVAVEKWSELMTQKGTEGLTVRSVRWP